MDGKWKLKFADYLFVFFVVLFVVLGFIKFVELIWKVTWKTIF